MLLKEVDKEKYFHVANGTVIRSVWELEPSLAMMGDDTFGYHANAMKNDFASWVRDVLQEWELADKIAACKAKSDMQIAVLRHLVSVLRNGAGV